MSDEQQLEEPEVKVVEAVQTLDELLQDEDAMWTKVSQPHSKNISISTTGM